MEYLAISLKGNKVAVYRFATSEVEPACAYLDMIGLPSPAVINSTMTTPLFALELFPHAKECCIVEPSPCTLCPFPPPSVLFWPDPALTAVTVQFHVFKSVKLRNLLGESLDSTFALLIPQSTFLEYIERVPAATTDKVLRVFPWRDWGERGSVVLRSGTLPAGHQPHVPGFYSNKAVVTFGSRTLLSTFDSTGEVRSMVVDVNPLAAAGTGWSIARSRDSFDAGDLANHPYIYTTYPRAWIGTR